MYMCRNMLALTSKQHLNKRQMKSSRIRCSQQSRTADALEREKSRHSLGDQEAAC